ncbi:MAG: hypothetical protein CML66_25800 [Rhodobacteraceae bacterium]|nr:hypothetical protein [Paracoccaceae bacterium]MAY44662.1 hypothetical protein [Paracoccaceae bacterium]
MQVYQTIHMHMRGLVSGTSKLASAASYISERWGCGTDASTISRKMEEQRNWTIKDVLALEDATGRFPVTLAMYARIQDLQPAKPLDVIDAAGAMSKEAGEAVAAALALSKRGSTAQAIAEWQDVANLATATIRALEVRQAMEVGDA